jgi:hypothetical protein
MATRSSDANRVYSGEVPPLFEELPVVASDIIWEGSAVSADTSGNMQPLVAGYQFRGFCEAKADNSTGSAGDIRVKIRRAGIVQLAVTGVAAASDVGLPVYATDDDVFTLTPTAACSLVGVVSKWITSTTCLVYFNAQQLQSRQRKHVITRTTAYTVVMPEDNRKIFSTKGATASCTFTLPAPAVTNAGCQVEFFAGANQIMIVSGTADKMITFNDLDADGVTFSTAGEILGAHVMAISDGAIWFISKLGAHTMTVAT